MNKRKAAQAARGNTKGRKRIAKDMAGGRVVVVSREKLAILALSRPQMPIKQRLKMEAMIAKITADKEMAAVAENANGQPLPVYDLTAPAAEPIVGGAAVTTSACSWLEQPLRPDTVTEMLKGLDEDEARTPGQVAAIVGGARRTAYVKLARMHVAGLVSREPIIDVHGGGGREYTYRKLPAGVEGAPLYDRQPGWDIIALARCFNLYTFRKSAIIQPEV